MSYPRVLQTLVIEDEASMVDTYCDLFKLLKDEGVPVAPPRVAQSLRHAETELERDRIFHMVILDLRLPNEPGGGSEEASARGLGLLAKIARRDDYPVPVLLIVTGDVRRAVPLDPVQKHLMEDFWYGRILSKGPDLKAAVGKGLEAALEYCDIGIHLVESHGEAYPPLSPREEDLLRRCVLRESAIGVDLRWWAAERRDRGTEVGQADWKKVFQGRFILPGDGGVTRPRFFKFESLENGRRSEAGARRLAQKLNHIAVTQAVSGLERSLLITDKAGPSNDEPLPLSAFLRRPMLDVEPSLPKIASDIAEQLCVLGDKTTEEHRLSALFWKSHDPVRLTKAYPGEPGEVGPAELLGTLLGSDERLWCGMRVRHGDLHIDNISLDQDTADARAYIFDPGAMSSGPWGQDLATLEVSLLLHQAYDAEGPSLVTTCSDLYRGLASGIIPGSVARLSDHHFNTRTLIQAIRAEFLNDKECDLRVYALLLLDATLIQLGGLAFGTSQNKIFRHPDAMELFRQVRDWLPSLGQRISNVIPSSAAPAAADPPEPI